MALVLLVIYAALYTNVPMYLATSKYEPLKLLSLRLISSDTSYYEFDYFGMDRVNFLLSNYHESKNINDGDLSKVLLKSACISIEKIKKEELLKVQSLSFMNAVIDKDEDIILLWLYRGINLNELKIESSIENKTTKFYNLYETIKKHSGDSKVLEIINLYQENKLNLSDYNDPCNNQRNLKDTL